MSYFYLNVNPYNKFTNDCTVRAIAFLLDQSWDRTYDEVCEMGYAMKEMPSTNRVWSRYLSRKGYEPHFVPNTCPDCYTVKDFCADHPAGSYLLALDEHVVVVVDGHYYDTWDCGDMIPFYYWSKEKN